MSRTSRHPEGTAPPAPKLVVKWPPEALKLLAGELGAHLEALERADDVQSTCDRAEEFLEPFALSPEDEHLVTMLARGKQCIDCGDVQDYYMVSNSIWKEAGLEKRQCCCLRCLSGRLGRPLKWADFTFCPANTWKRARATIGLLE